MLMDYGGNMLNGYIKYYSQKTSYWKPPPPVKEGSEYPHLYCIDKTGG